jgi:hypothetical protein
LPRTAKNEGTGASKPRKAAPIEPDASLIALTTELGAVLLAAGIGSTEFEAAARVGFVNAASRIARMGNARLNLSGVAAMTGLSRAEVRRVASSGRQPKAPRLNRQRALRVLDGWHGDRDFLDKARRPRTLAFGSETGEFELLVQRHSGDIPPRAILRELQRLELVSVNGQRIAVRRRSAKNQARLKVENVANALTPLLAALAAGTTGKSGLAARELALSVPDDKAHRLLHRQLSEATRAFFVSLRNAADAAESPRRGKTVERRKTLVSVLVAD